MRGGCLRLRAWSLLLACACLAAPALAQDHDNSINLHHAYMPTDGRGFVVVHGARTLDQADVHVGLGLSYARDSSRSSAR